MSLITKVETRLVARLTGAADFTAPQAPYDIRRSISLASGITAGKADKAFFDRRSVAASSSEDLDLVGSLADALGGTATFAKIKVLRIEAAASNVNNVVVGAASGSPWTGLLNSTGTITIRPGTVFMVAVSAADATAYAVTASTADLLKVANSGSGSAVVYDIAVIGTSA